MDIFAAARLRPYKCGPEQKIRGSAFAYANPNDAVDAISLTVPKGLASQKIDYGLAPSST